MNQESFPIELHIPTLLSLDLKSLLHYCQTVHWVREVCIIPGFWMDKIKLDFPKELYLLSNYFQPYKIVDPRKFYIRLYQRKQRRQAEKVLRRKLYKMSYDKLYQFASPMPPGKIRYEQLIDKIIKDYYTQRIRQLKTLKLINSNLAQPSRLEELLQREKLLSLPIPLNSSKETQITIRDMFTNDYGVQFDLDRFGELAARLGNFIEFFTSQAPGEKIIHYDS